MEAVIERPLSTAPHAPPGSGGPALGKHVGGLDSIRFICATWVVFGHFGVLGIEFRTLQPAWLGAIVRSVWFNLFVGPAAVIVFFLISGFCIHYPYRDGRPLPLKAYYSRRYVRILIPMAIAIALGLPLKLDLEHLNDSILWSLLAEEIYYLLYPLVLVRLRRRFGWRPVIAVAYLLSFCVVFKDRHAGNYASFGPGLNWLLGLPCWLLGCELAETIPTKSPSAARLWSYRLGIWALSSVASVLRFHSPLRFPVSLNLFALGVFFWLGAEIAYAERHGAPRWLEACGKWSYSIYLMHLHGHALYLLLGLTLASWLDWSLATLVTYLVCYTFYRLVEKPAHELARRIARRILVREPLAATAGE
jgi:peptidoglycan/LPS O-acetylase OafA/YrhL